MTQEFNKEDLKKLYLPKSGSHKGQNGKLLIIGGSHLFHGASLWALKVASRIVDMVFYASIPENNELTQKLKSEIFDFIAIPREKIDSYIEEADVVLLGPGLPREEGREKGDDSTRELTNELLKKYPHKKWVIDAGSLTEMEPKLLLNLDGNVVLTPHPKEFEILFNNVILRLKAEESQGYNRSFAKAQDDIVQRMAREYNCTILLKGQVDSICSRQKCVQIVGGNAGMTKGGTGDVLAALIASLACKNDMFLSACIASFINKKAADELFKKVGFVYNTSDLVEEIPKVMKNYLI